MSQDDSQTNLPSGWTSTTLGSLGNYWNGRGFKKSEWRPAGQGRPIIRIQDLTGTSSNPNYFDGDVDERNVARKGDLLVSWAATLGVYEWQGPESVINQHIFKVESFVNLKWHRYLIEFVLADLKRQSHGSGMVHVTRGVFDSIPVHVPPIPEQARIVAAIEEQFSRVDEAEITLRRVRKQSDLLLTAALCSLATDSPVPLGDLLVEPLANGRSVVTGQTGVPVLRLTAIRHGRIDLSQRKIGAWKREDAQRFFVRAGDFLISRGNGSLSLVGRAGVVDSAPDEVAYPDTMIRARLDGRRIHTDFLRVVWDTPAVRQQIEAQAKTTAGIYKVNQQDLAKVVIPVPNLDAQVTAVSDIERWRSHCDSLSATVDYSLIRSEHLRRSILKQAFSGQLVHQDDADEPSTDVVRSIQLLEHVASTPRRRRRA